MAPLEDDDEVEPSSAHPHLRAFRGASGVPSTIVTPAYPASEANAVILNFKALSKSDRQSVLDFLRSL
jgi:hypothetical protein